MSMIQHLAITPKQKRIRSRAYLAHIHTKRCCICGYSPVQAHHLLRTPTNERGIGRKSGDNWCLPLCMACHDELHRVGDEACYLARFDIDGPALAKLLYAEWVAS